VKPFCFLFFISFGTRSSTTSSISSKDSLSYMNSTFFSFPLSFPHPQPSYITSSSILYNIVSFVGLWPVLGRGTVPPEISPPKKAPSVPRTRTTRAFGALHFARRRPAQRIRGGETARGDHHASDGRCAYRYRYERERDIHISI